MDNSTKRVFKIIFKPDDIRRISLNVSSYETFLQTLESIYPPELFHVEKIIQYVDEEGDKCTLSCEKEFSAMLEIFPASTPIKLTISEGKNFPQYYRDGPVPEFRSLYISNDDKQEELDPQRGAELNDKIQAVLLKLTKRDKIIPHHLPAFVARFVKVKILDQEGPESDLDVDVTGLIGALFKESYNLIRPGNNENLEKAKTYLECILTISPIEQPALLTSSLYNMACVESLLGNLESSVQYLDRAVVSGYHDAKHIRSDSDLDNIRGLESYKSVLVKLLKLSLEVQQCEKAEEELKTPVVEVPKQEEIKKETPVVKEEAQVAKEEKPEVKQETPAIKEQDSLIILTKNWYPDQFKTLVEMGFAEIRCAEMLQLTNGDLAVAIERMLN